MRVSAKKSVVVINILKMICRGMPLKLLDHTSRHCCRNSSESSEKLQQGFIIIGMSSYLLKEKLQIQSTEKWFCICLWKRAKKFSTKKLIQTIIEKLYAKNDFRLTSTFKIIISFSFSLVENIKVFTQKMSVLFLYFVFEWRGVKPTSISNKICRKWNFLPYLS